MRMVSRRTSPSNPGAMMSISHGVSITQTRQVEGGIAAPKGFRAAGVACGIKASGARDLTLLAADGPASAAAVFTTSGPPMQ